MLWNLQHCQPWKVPIRGTKYAEGYNHCRHHLLCWGPAQNHQKSDSEGLMNVPEGKATPVVFLQANIPISPPVENP